MERKKVSLIIMAGMVLLFLSTFAACGNKESNHTGFAELVIGNVTENNRTVFETITSVEVAKMLSGKEVYTAIQSVDGLAWQEYRKAQQETAVKAQAEAAIQARAAAASNPAAGQQASGQTGTEGAEQSVPQEQPPVPAPSTAPGGSPYGEHGALRVQGPNLVDRNGNPYQLYGMSTHGLAWFPDYVNQESFQTLRSWNTNCVRLAMYTAEYGGYCTGGNQEELKGLVSRGVDYATNQGMYVIIDWHVLNDQNPNTYKEQAKAFFAEMSAKYRDRDNIIYEICNEPNSSVDWAGIKSYAQEIIPIIRANDSNAVIIVGTPTWSQEIDKAAADPLPFDNVLYALHFYAATHTEWLRERARTCINGGLPVIISEFGMCDASGNGGNNFDEAGKWMELIRQYNLSYFCWNLANKAETSSILNPGCTKTSGWTMEDLSESGRWIVNQFQSE